MKIFYRKGQSAVEYVTLIIIVMVALLAMQNYFKRGVQGRWRSSVDGVGEQYDPLFTSANILQRIEGNTVTTIEAVNASGGTETLRSDKSLMIETKSGYFRVDAQ